MFSSFGARAGQIGRQYTRVLVTPMKKRPSKRASRERRARSQTSRSSSIPRELSPRARRRLARNGPVRRACPTGSGRGLRLRAQRELLNAPIQQLGDVQLVLRRAGDLVDPAELLRLMARLAEPAEDLAVQGQLV